MAAPLEHLRVVDLTDLRGALAGRMLADLGADVLKIEPTGGDPGRLRPPFAGGVPAPGRSLPFLYRNAGKRAAVVDLEHAAGRERLRKLLDGADLLVENLGRAGQEGLGLTPQAVAKRHPHLVQASIADFGLSGPRSGWRAESIVALAASGALYASGFPDLPPCWLPGYLAHDCAAVFAVVGALAALLERARSGRGQPVEVSVQEAAIDGLNSWSITLADYGRLFPFIPSSPGRNADGAYHVLRVRDGYIRVLPGSPRQWRRYHEFLGEPEALGGAEWEQAMFRLANQDVIRIVSGEALAELGRDEALRRGRPLGFPIVPVNTPEEFVVEEQTRVRGFFRKTGFPHLADAPFAPAPFNFSRTPVRLERPAPAESDGPVADFASRDEKGSGVLSHHASHRERTPDPFSSAGPILAGVRVIGLAVGAVGPEVCRVLADLGAEVVKVESRANLDFLRFVTFDGNPNHSWTFNDECRGMKSVCLDLSTPRGRELALRLCAAADIIIENNRGGVARQRGLAYEDVRRVRPDVIYLASQGFGEGGPLGECPSFGPLNSTIAGVNWLWNHPEAPYPAGVALNHPDHIASKLGVIAVLAALEHRRRTGEGQKIEMSQAEAAAFLAGEFYLEEAATGERCRQRGNAALYAAPHGVYRCRAEGANEDRWVAIAVVGDDAWERFCRCLGWENDPLFATLEGRLAERTALDRRVGEWTIKLAPEEAAARLQAAGVSAMAVQNADEHRADAHLAERGAIIAVEPPDIGRERHIGCPIRLGRSPLSAPRPAPLLGQHTEEVLGAFLGLARDEIAALVDSGVCR